MDFSKFIMEPITIEAESGGSKMSLDKNKLLRLRKGQNWHSVNREEGIKYGSNCIVNENTGVYLMWGFRAKKSGFTDNIDKYIESIKDINDVQMIYAQVTKDTDQEDSKQYYFLYTTVQNYADIKNSLENDEEGNKNITLKPDPDMENVFRWPQKSDVYGTEADMYGALADLINQNWDDIMKQFNKSGGEIE